MKSTYRVSTSLSHPATKEESTHEIDFPTYQTAMSHYRIMKKIPAVTQITINKVKIEEPVLIMSWDILDGQMTGPGLLKEGEEGSE